MEQNPWLKYTVKAPRNAQGLKEHMAIDGFNR